MLSCVRLKWHDSPSAVTHPTRFAPSDVCPTRWSRYTTFLSAFSTPSTRLPFSSVEGEGRGQSALRRGRVPPPPPPPDGHSRFRRADVSTAVQILGGRCAWVERGLPEERAQQLAMLALCVVRAGHVHQQMRDLGRWGKRDQITHVTPPVSELAQWTR